MGPGRQSRTMRIGSSGMSAGSAGMWFSDTDTSWLVATRSSRELIECDGMPSADSDSLLRTEYILALMAAYLLLL
jgi:hypothetical protein